LAEPESKAEVLKLNTLRTRLTGFNQRPLPAGSITTHTNGSRTLVTADGRHFEFRLDGTLSLFKGRNRSASFSNNGRLVSLHTPELDVRTGPRGAHMAIWRRPDHSVLVTTAPGTGYLETGVVLPGNQPGVRRVYFNGSNLDSRTYVVYTYNGADLLHYTPEAAFDPVVYGWVYYPWKPVTFKVGFGASVGPAANQTYFTPSESYPSGYSWLADFDISGVLEKAFGQERQSNEGLSRPAPSSSEIAETIAAAPVLDNLLGADTETPITPVLKDAVADEVRRQLAVANAASSGKEDLRATELPAALELDHVFVVSSILEVNTTDDESCNLSGGDVLRLMDPPADGVTLAHVRVAAGRRDDCPAGEIVAVNLQDLQEMQNDLRASIVAGLRVLRDNQGKEGWPQAPASVAAALRNSRETAKQDTDVKPTELVEAINQKLKELESSVLKDAFGTL
jgi:hypothetical protein